LVPALVSAVALVLGQALVPVLVRGRAFFEVQLLAPVRKQSQLR